MVAISAVARSTGQELSHENNALPLLLWHLALDAWARQRAGRPLTRALAGWGAAGLAVLALCWGDLVQFYLGLFMLWGLAEALRGKLAREDLWYRYVPMMAGLLAAAVRNPYLATHGFGVSPVMWLGWGVLLAGAPIAQRQSWVTRLVLALLPWLAGWALIGRYFPAYSHFSSLLWAKLRYLNIRPTDPACLTFTQRILWAPALNSTSWGLLWEWFPALLVLTGLAIWSLMKRVIRGRIIPDSFPFLLVLVVASFGAFVLFFRFHVWLVIFACAMVGLWVGQLDSRTQPGWKRSAAIALLAGGWALEAWQPWMFCIVWGTQGNRFGATLGWASVLGAPQRVCGGNRRADGAFAQVRGTGAGAGQFRHQRGDCHVWRLSGGASSEVRDAGDSSQGPGVR